jgi:membrane fusion protein, heavy metal efflux system
LGGYLKSTRLLPGMHVNRGDVIAVMQDQQYIQLQQDYMGAKARLPFLEQEYNRQKELNKSQAASDKIYQQAEMEYHTQLVLLTSLREKLKLAGIPLNNISETHFSSSINIHSPIDGFVTKVNVNIGKYISPTDVLFELVNPSDIHLSLDVFEKDIDKLYIGQPLIAFTNNDTTKKYSCEILLIGKDLTPERSTEVHCHFETYNKLLIPGTYMNAEIAVKNKKAFVLPEQSVVQFENNKYVFVVKDSNRFVMQQVETGITEKGLTEIITSDNVSASAFVVEGAYSLLMQLKNQAEE